MKATMYKFWRQGRLHAVVSGGSAIAHSCKETLSNTLCLSVTMPADSWPEEMAWSCMACGRRQESHLKSCSSCTTGKRERIWALYVVGEVLSTWMRLLYPAEAANPLSTRGS